IVGAVYLLVINTSVDFPSVEVSPPQTAESEHDNPEMIVPELVTETVKSGQPKFVEADADELAQKSTIVPTISSPNEEMETVAVEATRRTAERIEPRAATKEAVETDHRVSEARENGNLKDLVCPT
ncbi:MAG: hypothetical protein HY646_13620, partial [Acidobacteria bacterium]|nr:hypothetical protein [Acidobacteriota bacterium]